MMVRSESIWRASGNDVGTGFLSTVFLCEVLAENGRLDVAYNLLTQKTIPSWLYAVTKGATTIWEAWEGIDESGDPNAFLNHYSPGAVISFLHRKLAEPSFGCCSIRLLRQDLTFLGTCHTVLHQITLSRKAPE